MKISKNWLCEFLNTDLTVNEISEYLTNLGLEVEGVENYVYRDSLENPMVSHFKIIDGGHTWDYNSFLSNF